MSVTIIGLQETITIIDRAISRLNFEQVFSEVANQMLEQIRSKTPVRTGYLRDHNELTEVSANGFTLSNTAEYAIYVEFGTYKMAARDFFFSSINELMPQLIQQIQTSLVL